MATFSEAQISTLSTILLIDNDLLTDHLEFNQSAITASNKTDIETLLTDWETAKSKFTSIEPNLRNFGAKSSHNAEKQQIREQLAVLTRTTEYVNSGGRLVRG